MVNSGLGRVALQTVFFTLLTLVEILNFAFSLNFAILNGNCVLTNGIEALRNLMDLQLVI